MEYSALNGAQSSPLKAQGLLLKKGSKDCKRQTQWMATRKQYLDILHAAGQILMRSGHGESQGQPARPNQLIQAK